MGVNKLIDQAVNTWRVNDRINLHLIQHSSALSFAVDCLFVDTPRNLRYLCAK